MELKDYHDYDNIAAKEEDRCSYCKIALTKKEYQEPVEYEEHYKRFQFADGGRYYGHPACLMTEMVDRAYIHLTRHLFLLHKWLRLAYGYRKVLVKAPPRELLPAFLGPLQNETHYGEMLRAQSFICEQLYEPFYVPEINNKTS